jgi:phage I-like protein
MAMDPAAVPTEFRIFRVGINHSEKGDFLFDAESATSVMAEYRAHGKPMLLDYNHGTTLLAPTPEQAISAGQFIPEVRADGLWATAIKWAERARAFLAAAEYRLFSPFFEHEAATGRITRLINVALTNLPALDHIDALVAAHAHVAAAPRGAAGDPRAMTAQQRFVARRLGITEADWQAHNRTRR